MGRRWAVRILTTLDVAVKIVVAVDGLRDVSIDRAAGLWEALPVLRRPARRWNEGMGGAEEERNERESDISWHFVYVLCFCSSVLALPKI